MSFNILHRGAANGTASAPGSIGSAPTWSTCLREVVFHDAPFDVPGTPGHEALADADAYAFLLETICGLHSPMPGETQVLGQFRAFLASLPPADASWLGAIGRQLTTDARIIRERHLRGLGARSYGSAVRRHLDGIAHVALIGAGALASELLPYVREDRAVDQWTRRELAAPDCVPVCGSVAAVIVAAPVAADAIAAVANRYPRLARVIDLRGPEGRDAFTAPALVTLEDLFAEVSASSRGTAQRFESARRDIRQMAAAFQRRHILRPFGWDDLCA